MKISVSLFVCGSQKASPNWITNNLPTPYRLYYVKGGSAYLRVGKNEIKLQKNCFYLFPSSLPFVIRQDPNDRLDHLYYNFIMSPTVISSEPICMGLRDHELFPHFLEIMEQSVIVYKKSNSRKDREVVVSILEAFLTLMLTQNPVTNTENSDILKSIEYMERKYKQDITIKEIAAELFLSEDYFIRKFKKAMGMTPYSYLSRLRLSIATELLSGGVTLQKAAEATGFKYASSLSHALNKENSNKNSNVN